METKIIIWLVMVGLSVVIAALNNRERLYNIRNGIKTQVNHPVWFALYSLPCVVIGIYSWQLGISVLMLHGSVFPVVYNAIAKIDLFHLSTTSESKYDQFLVKLGLENMVIPDLIAIVASLIFLWI